MMITVWAAARQAATMIASVTDAPMIGPDRAAPRGSPEKLRLAEMAKARPYQAG